MVYRKTVQALLFGTALATAGVALADTNESAEDTFVEDLGLPDAEVKEGAEVQTSSENLIENLLGKTVHLSGDVSLVPPMRQIPMKTYRADGKFAEYYPYIIHATAEGVELPALVFYSKTPRDEGFVEVTGVINEQNARTGTKGSGMLYLKETDD